LFLLLFSLDSNGAAEEQTSEELKLAFEFVE
jgi:hypothetical protein